MSRSRRLRYPASPVPRLLVGLDLEAIHQLVVAAEQVDDGQHRHDPFVIQPVLPQRGSVDTQSVVAGVNR